MSESIGESIGDLMEELENLRHTCDELRKIVSLRDSVIEQMQMAKLAEQSPKDPAWDAVKDRVPIGLLSRMTPTNILSNVIVPLESAIKAVRSCGFENSSANPIIQAIVKGL